MSVTQGPSYTGSSAVSTEQIKHLIREYWCQKLPTTAFIRMAIFEWMKQKILNIYTHTWECVFRCNIPARTCDSGRRGAAPPQPLAGLQSPEPPAAAAADSITKRFFTVFWNKSHAHVLVQVFANVYKCSVIENTSCRFHAQQLYPQAWKNTRGALIHRKIWIKLHVKKSLDEVFSSLQQAPVSIIVFTFLTYAGLSTLPITAIRNRVQIHINTKDTHFLPPLILHFEGEGWTSGRLQTALHTDNNIRRIKHCIS